MTWYDPTTWDDPEPADFSSLIEYAAAARAAGVPEATIAAEVDRMRRSITETWVQDNEESSFFPELPGLPDFGGILDGLRSVEGTLRWVAIIVGIIVGGALLVLIGAALWFVGPRMADGFRVFVEKFVPG